MRSQPIPLAMFSNCTVRGGAEEHMLLLLQYLDRRLFQPHLICGPELAEALQRDLPGDVELFTLSFGKFTDLTAAFALWRILRTREIQILHSHMFWSSLFASPVGRLARVPVIIETTHVRELWRKGWFKSSYFVDRQVSRCVTRYIAVSRANARYLAEEKRIHARKIVVVQNGSDLSRFTPDHRAPAGLRESLGIAAADPVLLVAARLEEQKGHRVLLQALPAIRRRFPRVRVVCVGDGALRPELQQLTQNLGVQESVRFIGYQSNITDWYALADITVLPSFYEGLPLVAIESLASGKPVVATAVDGTPEVVVDGKTGLLVPPGDPGKLAEAICRILGEDSLRQDLAQEGRRWVTERFSRERQIRDTEELYLSAWSETTGEVFGPAAEPPAQMLEHASEKVGSAP